MHSDHMQLERAEADPMAKSIQSLMKQVNKQEKMIADLENTLAEVSKK